MHNLSLVSMYRLFFKILFSNPLVSNIQVDIYNGFRCRLTKCERLLTLHDLYGSCSVWTEKGAMADCVTHLHMRITITVLAHIRDRCLISYLFGRCRNCTAFNSVMLYPLFFTISFRAHIWLLIIHRSK